MHRKHDTLEITLVMQTQLLVELTVLGVTGSDENQGQDIANMLISAPPPPTDITVLVGPYLAIASNWLTSFKLTTPADITWQAPELPDTWHGYTIVDAGGSAYAHPITLLDYLGNPILDIYNNPLKITFPYGFVTIALVGTTWRQIG